MVAAIKIPKAVNAEGKLINYNGKFTFYVLVVAIIASMGGLLFGYDIGVTGGVSAMPAFLQLFFPDIYQSQQAFKSVAKDPYCTYNSNLLQFFTSIAFVGGLISAPLASVCTKKRGRKLTLLLAGVLYLIGAVLLCSAYKKAQIFIGRLILGFGIGFANQVTPMYLAETSPAQYRGAMTILFQLFTTIGILVAQLINYGTSKISFGWRISLGLMGGPALCLIFGSLVVPETPNSLIERKMDDKGLKVLRKLRGVSDVEYEFNDIKQAAEAAQKVKSSWSLLFSRRYSPQLVTCILMPFFQQFSGINIIMFYAPQIFSSIGGSVDQSLLNTVINGCVNVGATFVAIAFCDRLGRKFLLLAGGYQMLITQVAFGALLGATYKSSTYAATGAIPKSVASALLALACIFVAGFAWSWGPIAWVIPSEILTLETRSAGQGINTSVNFLFTFVVGQSFLSMFCKMRFGVFIFFAGWVFVMTMFTHLFLVESRNVPIEEVHYKYRSHWFWKRVVGSVEEHDKIGTGNAQGKESNTTQKKV